MRKLFGFLLDYFKGIGWKEFLKNFLICVLVLAVLFTLFFFVGVLISYKPVLGIIIGIILVAIIIGIQALIVEKNGRE